jgi:hypothetical protein
MKDEASYVCDSCGEEIVVHLDFAPQIQWPFAKYGMQSFQHFMEAQDSSNKVKAMTDHRHNLPVTGRKFAIGCQVDEKLVGVAIAGRPVARRLDDGKTLEVLRV